MQINKITFLVIALALANNFTFGASVTVKRQFFNLFASMMGEEQTELPEINWDNVASKKIVKIKMRELELNEKELFQKVEECVKKCMEKSNPDRSYRDNCIAKFCDIY
jgi:hypothetical protein